MKGTSAVADWGQRCVAKVNVVVLMHTYMWVNQNQVQTRLLISLKKANFAKQL